MKRLKHLLVGLLVLCLWLGAVRIGHGADFPGEERVELALLAARLELLAAREDPTFWTTWQRTDRAIVKLFHKDPAFTTAVQFQDPDVMVDAWPLLLQGLLDNARWLERLGRRSDANRVWAVTTSLVDFSRGEGGLWSTLVLNTLSRFLLAGWRDVDDPVATLQFQVKQALANGSQLRTRIAGRPAVDRVPLWRALTVALATRGLPPWSLLRIGASLSPVNPVPPIFGALPPLSARTELGSHDPLLDDLTYALNLPFALAPPGTPVTRHLARLPTTIPRKTALLLGGGDGAEALAVAASGRFDRVVVVEHSPLAVRRNRQMAAALATWLAARGSRSPIEAWQGNVAAATFPANETSLVLAIHLLEYLENGERDELYRALNQTLVAGGQVVIAVHLAHGDRFTRLTTGFGNVLKEQTDDGVKVLLTHMVPADPDAVQVQQFFREGPLRQELETAFPPSEFDHWASMERTPAGFAEYTAVLTKK